MPISSRMPLVVGRTVGGDEGWMVGGDDWCVAVGEEARAGWALFVPSCWCSGGCPWGGLRVICRLAFAIIRWSPWVTAAGRGGDMGGEACDRTALEVGAVGERVGDAAATTAAGIG